MEESPRKSFVIVYRYLQQSNGEDGYEKLMPSTHYRFSTEYLLKRIENEPNEFDCLVVPFILTLSAWLEAGLNDYLLIDTFIKHGSERYKNLAEGYVNISFSKKLRLVVAILTDNTFQLRDDSAIVQKLDRMIAARNKITHPVTLFYVEPRPKGEEKVVRSKITDHPMLDFTPKDCRDFYQAVEDFDRLFFAQYDLLGIFENELICELKRA